MATSRILYTAEERVDMVRFYFENGNCAAAALRKWKTKYGRNQTLTDRSLQRYVIFAEKSVKFSKFNKEVCFFAIGFWVNWQPGNFDINESLCNTDSSYIWLDPIELIVWPLEGVKVKNIFLSFKTNYTLILTNSTMLNPKIILSMRWDFNLSKKKKKIIFEWKIDVIYAI